MYIIREDDEQFQNFIHNLIMLRERHQLNHRQMAAILHITPHQLRLLEKGRVSSRVYVDLFFYLHRHFGLSFYDMFHKRL